MNKFLSVLSCLVVFVLLSACTVESPRSSRAAHNACAKFENEGEEIYAECLKKIKQKQVERRKSKRAVTEAPATPIEGGEDFRDPDYMPEPPAELKQPRPPIPDRYPPGARQQRQPVSMDFAPNGDEGCMPGQNLSIPNESQYYLEVGGTDLRHCGGEGIVKIWVSLPNGGKRIANVIPPGATGTYYFYPWREVNGEIVSTNGRKEYTVKVFDAGSIKGLSASTPAAHIATIKQFVVTPLTSTWWKNPFTNRGIEEARALQ